MSICDYIYVSGMRVASGRSVVVIDGKRLRVVRDGKGGSRLDLAAGDPPSDGEITLKDLKSRLKKLGTDTIEVAVHTEDGTFHTTLDPTRAMGRKGRNGDYTAALAAMSDTEREIAARYQLRTLPYGDENANVAKARLAEVLNHVDITECTTFLPPQFALFAPKDAMAAALSVAAPADALRFGSKDIPDDLFNLAARAAPLVALTYALDRLSKGDLVMCARLAAVADPSAMQGIFTLAGNKLNGKDRQSVEDRVVRSLRGLSNPIDHSVVEKFDTAFTAAIAAHRANPDDPIAKAWFGKLLTSSPDLVLSHHADLTDKELNAHVLDARRNSVILTPELLIPLLDRLDESNRYGAAKSLMAAQISGESYAQHLTAQNVADILKGQPWNEYHLPDPLLLQRLAPQDLAKQLNAAMERTDHTVVQRHMLQHATAEQLAFVAERTLAGGSTSDAVRLLELVGSSFSESHRMALAMKIPKLAVSRCAEAFDDDEIARLAEHAPGAALEHALSRLSRDQVRRLAERAPDSAFACALEHLDREQIPRLARRAQIAALTYAAGELDQDLLRDLCANNAGIAISSGALALVTDKTAREAVIRSAPQVALREMAAELDENLLVELARQHRDAALEHAAQHLPRSVALDLITSGGEPRDVQRLMLQHFPEELSELDLADLIRNDFNFVLKNRPDVLDKGQLLHAYDTRRYDVGALRETLLKLDPDAAAALLDEWAASPSPRTDDLDDHIPFASGRLRGARRAAVSEFSDAELDIFVRRNPRDAVELASERLTTEHLAIIAEKSPSAAIPLLARFEPAQRVEIAISRPVQALRDHAGLFSSDEVATIVDSYDSTGYVDDLALLVQHATPVQRTRLLDRYPAEALSLFAAELQEDDLERLSDRAPEAALRHAAEHLPKPLLERLSDRAPAEALMLVAESLETPQRASLAERAPEAALRAFANAPHLFDTPTIQRIVEQDASAAYLAVKRHPELIDMLDSSAIRHIVEQEPAVLREFKDIATRLDEADLDSIARSHPRIAFSMSLADEQARFSKEAVAIAVEWRLRETDNLGFDVANLVRWSDPQLAALASIRPDMIDKASREAGLEPARAYKALNSARRAR